MTNTAEAQVLVAPDNGIPSGSSRAEVALQVPRAFQGDKIDWHGFDRYDFVMDKQTLAITRFKAPAGEQSGDLGNSDKGQLRSVVVVRKQALPVNPWSWRGVYWESPAPGRSRTAQTGVFTSHTFRSTPSQGH